MYLLIIVLVIISTQTKYNKGNVTGNVSGTAGGLSSTLNVDKGGTG